MTDAVVPDTAGPRTGDGSPVPLPGLPLYRTEADVAANRAGPRGILPWLPIDRRTVPPGSATLFGRRLRGVVGVAASPLTANASWVSAMAGAGFDVLTRKTVRSSAHPAHPFPQWLLGTAVADRSRAVSGQLPVRLDPLGGGPTSSANSFGVPSGEPAAWQADLEACLRTLGRGQLLIASVMGSPEFYSGPDLVADFVRVARLAAAVGVPAVELNLSCPNTLKRGSRRPSGATTDEAPAAAGSPSGAENRSAAEPLCADVEAATAVVEAVRAALPSQIALVAKLSVLPAEVLHTLVARLAPAVSAIAGVNAVQRTVLDAAGGPAFGAARAWAGVSGGALKTQGLEFVRAVHLRRRELGAGFSILGMGGVLTPADVRAYLDAGADVVQSVTGACLDPGLANAARTTP